MVIEKKDNSQTHAITFSIVASKDDIKAAQEKATEKLAKKLKVQGFRKGKVPHNLLLQQISQEELKKETIEILLVSGFKEALKQEELSKFLGQPIFDVDSTQFKPEKDFSFSISLYKIPDVVLGDYKTLTVKPSPIEITEQDLQEEQQQFEKFLRDLDTKNTKQLAVLGKNSKTFEELLRQYTAFKTLEEFVLNARKAVHNRKIRNNLAAFTNTLLDEILKISKVIIPEILITLELEDIIDKIRLDLSRYKTSLEDYLKQKKKTFDEFKKEQLPLAQKTAQIKVLLSKIAEHEHITVSEQEIDTEKNIMLDPWYGADKKLTAEGKELAKKLASPEGTAYVTNTIRRDKTITFLLEKIVPKDYGKMSAGTLVTPSTESGKIIIPGK